LAPTTPAKKRIGVIGTLTGGIDQLQPTYKQELPVLNKHQTSLLSKDCLSDLFFNIIKAYSTYSGVWVTNRINQVFKIIIFINMLQRPLNNPAAQ